MSSIRVLTHHSKTKVPWDIDLVVIRENTEGEYANVGGFQYQGFPEEVGVQVGVFTRHGCERIITYAFEQARARDKKRKVTFDHQVELRKATA